MSKFYPLTVKSIRRETADCVSVAFDVPVSLKETFQFIQGQYLTLKTTIGGEEVRRSYSICSSPLEAELRVAIKAVTKGVFSTYANEVLEAGEVLEVMPPMGRFYTPLSPSNRKHYVAFAAGSGITPVMSILKTVLQTEPESSFTLVYGNKNRHSIIFKEELEALKNKYMNRLSLYHILSREFIDSPLLSGRITGEKCVKMLESIIDAPHTDEFFLCGPEEMIFAVKESLEAAGVDKKKVHFELFTTSAQPARPKTVVAAEDGAKCKVSVKLDGRTFEMEMKFGEDTILDAALKQGADLPFACKGGVCCTCRAKIMEGEVEMGVNYALEPEEVEAGYVLTCQSFPISEKVTVDFDVR